VKFRFTYHAQSQAIDRIISESLIAEVVRHPDSVEPAPAGAMLFQKLTERGILEVVCKKGRLKNVYVILTAYYR
jgi:hypothetical protein